MSFFNNVISQVFGTQSSAHKHNKSNKRLQRSIRFEPLEKREMLSVSSPATPNYCEYYDSNGFTSNGVLVASISQAPSSSSTNYVTITTDTDSETINSTDSRTNADGSRATWTIDVSAGDTLTITGGGSGTTARRFKDADFIDGQILLEDWTDDDWNDFVLSLTFIPQELEPPVCKKGCDYINLLFENHVDAKVDSYSAYPALCDGQSIRFEDALQTKQINQQSRSVSTELPESLTATFTFGDLKQTVHYSTENINVDELYNIAMHLDSSSLKTGRYNWNLTVVSNYSDGSSEEQVYEGTKSVLNLDDSPYGVGFNIAGVSKLNLDNLNTQTNRGVNWERSCGKMVWFAYNGTSFTPESGESAYSSLIANQDGTYTLIDQGERFTFDSSGQLTFREILTSGETVAWIYNSDGTVRSKSDEAGRVTNYAYNAVGKLASVTDFAGRVTSYTYDSLGRRICVTEPDPDGDSLLVSRTTTYEYLNDTNLITQVTDPEGNVTQYSYQDRLLVRSTVNGIEQYSQDLYYSQGIVDLTQTGYDTDHLAVLPMATESNGELVNRYGNTTEYIRDANDNILWSKTDSGKQTWTSFDANGNTLSQTVSVGATQTDIFTRYWYDDRNNLSKILYSDGSTEQWTYDGVFDQVTSYTDQLGNVTLYTVDSTTGLTTAIKQIVGEVDSIDNGELDDVITTYLYNSNKQLVSKIDAVGVTTTYTYDAHGNVLTETLAAGTALAATTTYTYDSADRMISSTDPLGRTTNYEYDNLDRLVRTIYPAASTGAVRQFTQSVYNNAGQLYQSIDVYGAATTYTYDSQGRIASVTSPDPDGSGLQSAATSTYAYNSYGDLLTVTDSLGRQTVYTYNSAGKRISTSITDNNSSLLTPNSSLTYDAWGRTATETDAAGVTLAYTYDKLDRVKQIRRVNDNTVLETRTYDAAGNLKTLKDALNNTTTYSYDALGNLTRVTAPDGSQTNYAYDKLGRVVSEINALGGVTSYEYDLLGNQISVYLPNSSFLTPHSSFSYDLAGQLASTTDALGNVTTYAYDGLGRNISTTLSNAAGTESTTSTTAYSTQTVNGVTYQVVTQTDALNHSAITKYDPAGRMVQSTDAAGATTFYSYNSEGQLLSTTDALNHSTSYAYDYLGNVSAVTAADGTVTSYNYNAAGQLLSTTDAAGTTTFYTYSLAGQVEKTVVSENNIPIPVDSWLTDSAQTFDGVDDTMNLGNSADLNFSGEITLSAWVKPDATDSYRMILSHGNATVPKAETFLRIKNGYYEVGSYDSAGTICARYAIPAEDAGEWVQLTGVYDGTQWILYRNGEQVAAQTSNKGALTAQENWYIGSYDGVSRFFDGEIKEAGIFATSLTAVQAELLYENGFNDSTVLSTSTYNAAGWVTSQTDGEGNITMYTYDAMGRVLTVTDALNNVTSYIYDALGRVFEQTAPNGAVTRYVYNALGNVLQTIQYDSNSQYPVSVGTWLPTETDFNGTGNTVNLGNADNLNFSGEITLSAWVKPDATDSFRMILSHGNAADPKAETFLRIKNGYYEVGSYDSAGTVCARYAIPAEDAGEWVQLTGVYDGTQWVLYRNGEQVAAQTSNKGALTAQEDWYIGSYDGTSRFFDGMIKQAAIFDYAMTAANVNVLYTDTENTDAITTTYTYDANGNVLSLTDPVGNTTSYVYNYRGLVTAETNENADTRYFGYDAIGRMTEKTDRNGRETAYTYDAAGRLTSEVWLGANDAAVKTFTYTYDTLGRLLTVGDGVSNYVYSYDTMNRVDTMTLTFDGQTAVFDYSYDSVGRQTQSALTLNNVADRIVDTEYDYLGRAVSVQMKDSPTATDAIFAEFESNALGLVSEMRRYEQENDDITFVAKSVLQYNAANQLTNITHKDASNNTLVSHGYTFDTFGNISQYTNSLDGSVLYDYDFLGQLLGADYSALTITDESYSYDANGNRTMTGYVTGDNNELTSDGSWNYGYDAEGNRISKTNSTSTERELYEWDYRNRLTRVTAQTYDSITESWTTVQIVQYAYDYNNVLIRKMIDTDGNGTMDSKTLFLPENYQTAIQLDDSDLSDSTGPTVSHRYLWTPNQQDNLIADEQVTASGSNVLWALTDHLGTVRDIIQQTPSGIITKAHIIYDAYGNVLSCKDSNGIDIESPVIFGFTGKYFDADTQLQNNVNRWYDATTGRWLSIDPIGFNSNDTNLYRYVGNCTIKGIDAFGLKWIITRNGETTATATRENLQNDSIKELADILGLNESEQNIWLTPTEKKCVFKIPNTIYAFWGGDEVMGIGQWWVGWKNELNTLRSKGFNVFASYFNDSVIDNDLKGVHQYVLEDRMVIPQIKNLSDQKLLHGIVWWSHGCKPNRLMNGVLEPTSLCVRGVSWVRYSNVENALKYKLGFVLINACYGQSGAKTWASSNSHAIILASPNILNPVFGGGIIYDKMFWVNDGYNTNGIHGTK